LEELKNELLSKIENIEPGNDAITLDQVYKILNEYDFTKKTGIISEKVIEVMNQIKTLENQIQNKGEQTKTDVNQIIDRITVLESEKDVTPFERQFLDLYSVFNADKTAKVDYALSNNGGKVIAVNSNYPSAHSIPLFFIIFGGTKERDEIRAAENVIQTSMAPSHCWSFLGHVANVTIKLSCPIVISSISLEHPDSRILMNDMSSAPRQFQVYGTKYDGSNFKNMTQTLLIESEYNFSGLHLQDYLIDNNSEWNHITLSILSNHNHLPEDDKDYTCVYRLRVHSDRGCAKITTEVNN